MISHSSHAVDVCAARSARARAVTSSGLSSPGSVREYEKGAAMSSTPLALVLTGGPGMVQPRGARRNGITGSRTIFPLDAITVPTIA